MALDYKLEFNTPTGPSDDSVYIHLRVDVPKYISRVGKEEYELLDPSDQDAFFDGLFAVPGVVEISVKAFRVWIMKSPIFNWEEVIVPVLAFLQGFYGEDTFNQLPGSANQDGLGTRLESEKQRRGL
jgi:hypothetical protein